MSFEDFIQKWDGKPIDFDGVYPNQCMDLMHQYAYEVLGITDKTILATPSAYQVFTQFKWGNLFQKIENTPDNFPLCGDILLFGTSVGQWGHVCIVTKADINSFESFDANWPTGSLPHIQKHTYKGVLGWLRYIATKTDYLDELIEMRSSRDKWKSDYEKLEEKYTNEFRNFTEQIKLLQSNMAESSYQITTLNETISDLTLQNKSILEASRASELKYLDMTTKKDGQINELEKNILDLTNEVVKLNKEIAELKGKSKLKLMGYSFWERFTSLFKKGGVF